MTTRTAYTAASTVADAVQDLRRQLGGTRPGLLLYFASARFPPEALAISMEKAFVPATVLGCTTAGEITTGHMLKGSIVAMALSPEVVGDVAVQVLPCLDAEGAGVADAFAAFEAHFGTSMRDLDPKRHVGIILVDGMSGAEEALMQSIGNRTDVTFIGGSAGDDLAFKATHVFANGKAHGRAAVLAVLRVDGGFGIVKTQSFRTLDKKLVATRVHPERREVVEFDGVPALEAYAKALGVSTQEAKGTFSAHPLGLLVGDEPFVRSPQQASGSTIRFYCAIEEGMELSVLESTDIIEDTRRELLAKLKELGGASAVINFNCILRTLELDQKGKSGAYGKLFEGSPTVGLSTYGEAYFGHINQTATMLLLR
jgi:hypothetical protein